jgi:molybdopterin converting factor small subunit
MQIDIELYGQLLPNLQRRQTLTLEGEMNVQEVADLLGLNLEEVGLVVINGEQRDFKDLVPSGCRLCFFPHMTGG